MKNTKKQEGNGLPARLEATKWKKGFCPNPKGRPPSRRFSEAVRQLAQEVDPKGGGATGAERLAELAYRRALKGSVRHAELLLNYAEGKPKQSYELSAVPTDTEQMNAQILEMIARALKDPALGEQIRQLVKSGSDE